MTQDGGREGTSSEDGAPAEGREKADDEAAAPADEQGVALTQTDDGSSFEPEEDPEAF